MPAVRILAQDAGEQLDERHAADGGAGVEPHPIGADLHADVAAVGRVPLLDRRRALALPLLQQGLEPGNAVGAGVGRHRPTRRQVAGSGVTSTSMSTLLRATFIIMALNV